MEKPFNVITYNYNAKEFEAYNVMPYLIRCYKETKKPNRPKTFDDFKKFVKTNSAYKYWARCQYEIVLSDWPSQQVEKKIDVHWQIMNNIDTVTSILMENVL